MRNEFIQKIYYADTDAYGVVWHGAYLRWMEKGRCDFTEQMGFNLPELVKQDIALPVANMNVKFKASAKLNDVLVVETWVSKLTPLCATFSQTIKNKDTGVTYIIAEFDIVAVNNQGKLYRRIPQVLKDALEATMEEG
ncbi:MAG: acyl-CoA thioesterase [Cyanobacteria bacterium SIG28]|nr:acyl-CoA thioesterase [Cyanobacteria bacterium SIG28]